MARIAPQPLPDDTPPMPYADLVTRLRQLAKSAPCAPEPELVTTETASTIPLDLPFWFKQRQARAEEVAPGTWKLSGPNLPEAAITVRMTDDLTWQAALLEKVGGPELAVSLPNIPTAREALQTAFEL